MGARFRSETTLISSLGTAYVAGTKVLVTAAQVTGIQRVGVYRIVMAAGAAAGTFQFQDTNNNPISSIFFVPINGPFVVNMPINGDPLWMTGPTFQNVGNPLGVGLQLVTTGGPFAADVWVAWGA